jgi:hypothetical protein
MMRWKVQIVRKSLWIAYRSPDLSGAMLFRTRRHAVRYALAGGAL